MTRSIVSSCGYLLLPGTVSIGRMTKLIGSYRSWKEIKGVFGRGCPVKSHLIEGSAPRDWLIYREIPFRALF